MAGILSMFAASPFKPLRKHMEKVSECCGCIKALIEKTLSGNIDKNTQIAERIRLLEIDANRLKNDVRIAATDRIRIAATDRIMLPFDRVDLLELVTEQDKLANGAKGIAGLLEGRRLKVPKDHQESLIALVKSVLATIAITAKALGQLDDLMETGFIGKERKAIRETIADLETSADACWQKKVKLRRDLFEHETEMAPIDAVITYDLLERLYTLSDQAAGVGTRIEILLTRK